MPDDNYEQLKKELENGEFWQTRANAAQLLGLYRNPDAYEYLLSGLNDSHRAVRSSVIGALGNLGDLRAVEVLLSLLQFAHDNPKEYWSYSSAWSLGRLGDKRAVKPLIVALNHPELAMRSRVSTALGELGDQRAVEPLIQLLAIENSEHMYSSIAHALGMLKNPQAVEPLLIVLQSTSNESTRGTIVTALGRIGDNRAVPTLISLIEMEDGNVACDAAEALGEIGDNRAVEPLLTALQHPWGRGWVRSWAAEALGRFRDERVLQPLINALQDEDVSVRIAAVKGLMCLGDKRALPALDRVKLEDDGIDYDTGETVKWAATRARRYIRHIRKPLK